MYDEAEKVLDEYVMSIQELPKITMMKKTEQAKVKLALRRQGQIKNTNKYQVMPKAAANLDHNQQVQELFKKQVAEERGDQIKEIHSKMQSVSDTSSIIESDITSRHDTKNTEPKLLDES